MFQYPKLQTLYCRGDRGALLPHVSRPEFGLSLDWYVTEKLDGTSMRVEILPAVDAPFPGLKIAGRTNRADLSSPPVSSGVEVIAAWFDRPTVDAFLKFCPQGALVFGELCGPKIQGNPLAFDQPHFAAFDVYDYLEHRFLDFPDVIGMVDHDLLPAHVPVAGWMSRPEIVDRVEAGMTSALAPHAAEGVVCRTIPTLYNSRGERVMWKLKSKDFK